MVAGLTSVSLFAGVEGIGLAMERADVQVVAAVEIDPAARGVIADRFPHLTLFDDVTKVTGVQLIAAGFVPERGIIGAGWPCQGNSVAGARGGMADPRSGLWTHVVRLLAETRAAWFLGENVPGLLSVNDGDDFGVVLGDLADLGMGFCWRVLDAQHFGVPQRRRRVFVVGHLGDERGPVQVLLEPEGGGRDPAPGVTAGQGVAATLTAGVAGPGVSAPGRRQEDDVNLVPCLTSRAGNTLDDQQTGQLVVSSPVMALTANGVGTCGPDDNQAQAGHLVVAPTITAGWGTNHGSPGHGGKDDAVLAVMTATGGRGTPIIAATLRSHPRPGSNSDGAIIGFAWQAGGNNDASGAFVNDGSPTLPRSQTIAVQTATDVRRLTPLECERLQGFPDGWTATSNGRPQADSARYRQMGNAVAVPVVEWIARRIVAVDREPA